MLLPVKLDMEVVEINARYDSLTDSYSLLSLDVI